jgi:hypothetical protein
LEEDMKEGRKVSRKWTQKERGGKRKYKRLEVC